MVGSALFIYLHTSPQYAFWWGSRQNGIAGLVFSFIVGGMVFAVLWGTILLVGGSLMLARIMRFPIELTPFHSDGCNGLSPLGRQIFLLWLNAFLGSLAIYVALRLGYLGIEHNPLVWVLAMLGSLAVPALAVLPLVASLQAVKETQGANLERLGRFLNSQLAIAASAIGKGDLDGANKIISQLSEVKSLFEIYKAANVWPFNPRALMFIVTANCVQIILTSRQLLSLMPN
jgi:hypothetical protein